ncbi:hypothetical protein [Sediminibacter sp. Hel_I_10]|uniref:hypothetical protein n=1 Tax=Sediminibacter sp. Hel_I_10 TaxID=1392490 RepID=UPI00047ACD66|nr:hypothetical protein [Sediminibacter sp. Hel_I_10]
MAFDNFTKQQLFVNQDYNVILNQIYDILINEFTAATLNAAFCISGSLAKEIQGSTAKEITVIPFVTINAAIFKYFGRPLAKALGTTAILYKDRVQMTYRNVALECWLETAIGTINNESGIYVQDPADVPAKIN